MMLPLRNAKGDNIGEIVLAYKNPNPSPKNEKDYFLASTALRDSLMQRIPSYEALFEAAR